MFSTEITINITPEILQQKISEADQGLLFINTASHVFSEAAMQASSSAIHALLKAHEPEQTGRHAIIVAERSSPRTEICRSLAKIGIYDFDYTIIFEDYTTEELLEILHRYLKHLHLELNEEAAEIIKGFILRLDKDSQTRYANKRTIKLLSYAIQKISIANNVTSGIITADLVTSLASAALPLSPRLGF